MYLNNQIKEILQQKLDKKRLCSQMGFFSKPVRIKDPGGFEYVVKFYKPVTNKKMCQSLISNHDAYVSAMTNIGIRIPETSISMEINNKKYQLIIVQKAFHEIALVREQMKTAVEKNLLCILKLVLDDTLKFWQNKPAGVEIGFHPTLRNYALEKQLYYFDTFPPMLMSQKELNKILLAMAPIKLNNGLIPVKTLNIVSDEYYQVDKMVTGIIGSCCRLRPEFSGAILQFSREYILMDPRLQPADKAMILKSIQNPPRLSGIRVGVRKLVGKPGRPNV